MYWAYRILKLSNLVNIDTPYLGKFSKEHSSPTYFKNLMEFWEKKGYKRIKKCPLLWTSLRINICQLILTIFMAIIISFLSIANLYFFRLFIQIFMKPNIPLTDRDKYIGAIYLLIRLAKIVLQQKMNQYSAFMGNKSFLELKNLIFDKILKLSPSVDMNTGEIYNFVQIDSNKICKLLINLPNIFSIPIILIAYNYLLYQYIGISFIAGVVVMIIFLIINYYYRTQFSKYLKLHMKKSDSRINVTTEMINNLKM